MCIRDRGLLIDEGAVRSFDHRPVTCASCHAEGLHIKVWCGFYERGTAGEHEAVRKVCDIGHEHADVFFVHKKLAMTRRWARQWRYRLYSQRASFTGEAMIMQATQGNMLPATLARPLEDAWVRLQLWRRAGEAGATVQE
eukprot:7444902-Alexandrium_andersonii.AAC.1